MSGINMSRFLVGVVGECRIVMPNDPGEHLSSDKHVSTEKAKLEADLKQGGARSNWVFFPQRVERWCV